MRLGLRLSTLLATVLTIGALAAPPTAEAQRNRSRQNHGYRLPGGQHMYPGPVRIIRVPGATIYQGRNSWNSNNGYWPYSQPQGYNWPYGNLNQSRAWYYDRFGRRVWRN